MSIWPGRLSRNFTGHFMQVETEAFKNLDPERKKRGCRKYFPLKYLQQTWEKRVNICNVRRSLESFKKKVKTPKEN